MNNDTRPIIGFNGRRGVRFDWKAFDEFMAQPDTIVTFTRRSVSRDGLHETIVRCGSTGKNGSFFRTREFYGI